MHDELLHALTPGIHDIDSAIAGDGQIVREAELAVLVAEATEPGEHAPLGIRDRHTASVGRHLGLVAAIGHEHAAARSRIDGVGTPQLLRLPLGQEPPDLVEDLDAESMSTPVACPRISPGGSSGQPCTTWYRAPSLVVSSATAPIVNSDARRIAATSFFNTAALQR